MIDFDIQRRLYLCCYDISDTQARRGVHRIVSTFASGGQKSAYECFLSIGERHLLLNLTAPFMDECDNLVLQPLNKAQSIITLGVAQRPINSGFTFIG
ncbi:hypothetical protein AB4524_00820 [Vibrio breoganii]